eukprot:IDg3809t1
MFLHVYELFRKFRNRTYEPQRDKQHFRPHFLSKYCESREQQSRGWVKSSRRSKLSIADNIIIAQEVAAAEVHVASHGETQSRFEKKA